MHAHCTNNLAMHSLNYGKNPEILYHCISQYTSCSLHLKVMLFIPNPLRKY